MVKFKIHYKVDYGQSLCILGNASEVGNWKDSTKAQMRWTAGDFWIIELGVPKVFTYKYVVVQDGNTIRWE